MKPWLVLALVAVLQTWITQVPANPETEDRVKVPGPPPIRVVEPQGVLELVIVNGRVFDDRVLVGVPAGREISEDARSPVVILEASVVLIVAEDANSAPLVLVQVTIPVAVAVVQSPLGVYPPKLPLLLNWVEPFAPAGPTMKEFGDVGFGRATPVAGFPQTEFAGKMPLHWACVGVGRYHVPKARATINAAMNFFIVPDSIRRK